MLKTYKLSFLLLFLSLGVFGQTNTVSPYSSFGLGDISIQGVGFSRGMGGTGIGVVMQNQINFLNPASYTALDTLSFVFDAGLSGSRRKFETTTQGKIRNNVYFSHIGLSFPITRWWAATLGALPYSSVGYNITTPVPNQGSGTMNYLNEGSGDLNRYFIGTGFKYKNLSFGLNGSYLLGTLTYTNSVIPADYLSYVTESFNTFNIKGMYLNLGAQYTSKIGKDLTLILGATYEFKRSLSASDSSMTSQYLSLSGSKYSISDRDTIAGPSTINGKVVKPAKLGLGFSLNFKQKAILAMDYTIQDWSGFSLPGKLITNPEASLTKSSMFNFGLQYIPNPNAIRGYLPHVQFQLGGHYGDTYIIMRGKPIKDYGLSLGAGLPFKGGRSFIRINYEIGKRGTTESNLIRETYQNISLSLSLYDFWFVKPKFD